MKDLCTPDNRNISFNITLDDIRNALYNTAVSKKVPDKIKTMIEFAQKIFLYSFFEYDFYTLAMIYLALLTETAIKERFLMELPQEIELIKKGKIEKINRNYASLFDHLAANWKLKDIKEINKSLKSIMDWLFKQITVPERFSPFKLEMLRIIRNISAHLVSKEIYPPSIALRFHDQTIDFINCLFEKNGSEEKEE